MKALESYKSWPGFENPHLNVPVRVARRRFDIECRRRRFRKLASWLFRSRRWLRESFYETLQEFQTASKKTLYEVALGVVTVAIAVEPIRRWLAQWHFFWLVYTVALLLGVLVRLRRRRSQRLLVTTRMTEVALRLQIISDFQRKHTKEFEDGLETSRQHLLNSIRTVLQALVDTARLVLDVPESVGMYANIMIPMPVRVEGDAHSQHGCGIVAYSLNRPAVPGWTRLIIEDIGAPEAFQTGKVIVVEDTADPIWCGIFDGIRTKSFACFPILMDSGRTVAVVNIDATRSRVMTQKNAGNELHGTLMGSLTLLGDILFRTRVRSEENRLT